jgi:CHAT domain-containing protein/predicted negative regulator of RcsB-dependent stress response
MSAGQAQDFNSIKNLLAGGEEDLALAELAKVENKQDINYLNLSGEAYLHKGQYDNALQKFEQAAYLLEQKQEADKIILAATYSFIGVVNWTTGNNSIALQYHFKALDLRRSAGDEAAVAGSLNDIGLVFSTADPDNAIAYYEQALKIYNSVYGENHDKVSTSYLNIGIAKRNLEFYVEAIDNIEKSLAIRQQLYGTGTIQEAIVHSALGTVYEEMGDTDLALQELEIALSIYKRKYGAKHPELAGTYNLIGNVYYKKGDFKSALASYQKALIANLPDFGSRDIYQNPKPDIYYNADILLISLLEKSRAFEQLYATHSLKKADITMAYQTLELCDGLIDDIRQFRTSESDKVALGNTSADVYETAIRVSLAMADIVWKKYPFEDKAFYYADKSKSAVLLASIADANAKSFAGIPDDLLAQEQMMKSEVAYYEQKLAGKPSPEAEIRYRQELFDWTKNYTDLIVALELQYPTYFNLKHNTKIPSVAEIQKKLDEGTAMLSYFVGRNSGRIYLFVITKNNYKVYDSRLADDYDRNISGYRNAMYYDAPNTYKSTARALYTQLIPGKIPAGVKKLIVIPSGRMATIPFEALITRKLTTANSEFRNIPYLINNYRVSYQYAASLLMSPSIKPASRESIALFAPVDFQARRLSSLPGSKQEVNDIANLFAGSAAEVGLYINDRATKSAVRSDKVKESKYLHFATHGVVDEDKPERSEICLATTATEEGNLYSGDIYTLNLSADLVVLSACETGLGKISRGEGIIGLTRALIYAGSNNLVVSLWRVSDASTSLLMTDFYRSMLQGNDYGEALRLAKQGMISSTNYSSPYYWAPFVLIGE